MRFALFRCQTNLARYLHISEGRTLDAVIRMETGPARIARKEPALHRAVFKYF